MIGAFVLPLLVEGDARQVISNFAVAAGYLGFAWIERDGRIAAIAGVLAAVPLAALAIAPGLAGAITAAVSGSVLVASGVAFRRAQMAAASTAGAPGPLR